MSDMDGGPGWWLDSDGRWRPPEHAPGAVRSGLAARLGPDPPGCWRAIAIAVSAVVVLGVGWYAFSYWQYTSQTDLERMQSDWDSLGLEGQEQICRRVESLGADGVIEDLAYSWTDVGIDGAPGEEAARDFLTTACSPE